MEGISGVAQSIWQTIKNVFATGINWIIDKVNGLIDRFNSIAKTVPGVPTIQKLQRLEFQNGGIVP